MITYTTRNIYIISFIISIIFFSLINSIFFNNNLKDKSFQIYKNNIVNYNNEWSIEIPKIKLKVPIKEGTKPNALIKYVGHFKETSKTIGNVGLIIYNKNYLLNYPENIEELQLGDIIIYKYKDFNKKYIIEKNIIIEQTEWNYISETEENKVTLITGIKNNKKFRRCIQAVEQ